VLRHFRPDIVHAHGYKAAILVGIAARGLGATLVKTEHGSSEPRRRTEKIKMGVNDRFDRWMTQACFDGVVYVTNDLRRARGIKGRRLTAVIPNGVSLASRPSRTAGKLAVPGRFNVAVIGRLSLVKGHVILLRAIHSMDADQRPIVHVVGSGPLEADLRSLIRRLNLSDSIRLHGFLPDIESIVAEMDAIVMPSLNEGLPYVLLEAMRAGRAIVASNVGGLPEAIEDEKSGLLVPPRDHEALAAKLTRLAADPKLRTRLGKAARRRVEKDFSLERMAEHYDSFYHSLRRVS
jgi:L-malate glycosyltransferase